VPRFVLAAAATREAAADEDRNIRYDADRLDFLNRLRRIHALHCIVAAYSSRRPAVLYIASTSYLSYARFVRQIEDRSTNVAVGQF
jgi:hypothetical protein